MIASVIANVNRNAEAYPDPFTPEDFMPSLVAAESSDSDPLTPENTVRLCRALNAAFGGEVIDA